MRTNKDNAAEQFSSVLQEFRIDPSDIEPFVHFLYENKKCLSSSNDEDKNVFIKNWKQKIRSHISMYGKARIPVSFEVNEVDGWRKEYDKKTKKYVWINALPNFFEWKENHQEDSSTNYNQDTSNGEREPYSIEVLRNELAIILEDTSKKETDRHNNSTATNNSNEDGNDTTSTEVQDCEEKNKGVQRLFSEEEKQKILMLCDKANDEVSNLASERNELFMKINQLECNASDNKKIRDKLINEEKRSKDLEKEKDKLANDLSDYKAKTDKDIKQLKASHNTELSDVKKLHEEQKNQLNLVIERLRNETKEYYEKIVIYKELQALAISCQSFFDLTEKLEVLIVSKKASLSEKSTNPNVLSLLMHIDSKFYRIRNTISIYNQIRQEISLLASTGMTLATGWIHGKLKSITNREELCRTLQMLLYSNIFKTLAGAIVVRCDEYAITLPRLLGESTDNKFASLSKELQQSLNHEGLNYSLEYAKPYTKMSNYSNLSNEIFSEEDVESGTITEIIEMALNFGSSNEQTKVSAKQ